MYSIDELDKRDEVGRGDDAGGIFGRPNGEYLRVNRSCSCACGPSSEVGVMLSLNLQPVPNEGTSCIHRQRRSARARERHVGWVR